MTSDCHPRVLVLTRSDDAISDLVVEALRRRSAQVFRADVADFPQRLALTMSYRDGIVDGILRCATDGLRLSEVDSVYYRRPSGFDLPESLTDSEWQFAYEEARRGFGGALATLECAWLNHPARIADADYR